MFEISAKFWQGVSALLLIGLLALSVTFGICHYQKNKLKDELNVTKTELTSIKNSLKANAIAYQNMINEYKNKAPKIVTRYNTVYKQIEDSNATLKDKVFDYVKRMRNEALDSNSSL